MDPKTGARARVARGPALPLGDGCVRSWYGTTRGQEEEPPNQVRGFLPRFAA